MNNKKQLEKLITRQILASIYNNINNENNKELLKKIRIKYVTDLLIDFDLDINKENKTVLLSSEPGNGNRSIIVNVIEKICKDLDLNYLQLIESNENLIDKNKFVYSSIELPNNNNNTDVVLSWLNKVINKFDENSNQGVGGYLFIDDFDISKNKNIISELIKNEKFSKMIESGKVLFLTNKSNISVEELESFNTILKRKINYLNINENVGYMLVKKVTDELCTKLKEEPQNIEKKLPELLKSWKNEITRLNNEEIYFGIDYLTSKLEKFDELVNKDKKLNLKISTMLNLITKNDENNKEKTIKLK